ncbi:hypothetical protein [Acidicapsa ligni]|uniref:hypothetical protein n=1 Tax=Acidicapsa ligni TaxID=542300 RepID=UPI0021DFC208|nr:hypothetical protein [Acidicapsa ligni]
MTQMQRLGALGFAMVSAILICGAQAQVGDPATLDQEKLVSEIKLTKTAADHTDIVTAGDVVVLHKDGLIMCSSASSFPAMNIYSGGVLVLNQQNRIKDSASKWLHGLGQTSLTDAAKNGCTQRKFVAGEKFWVTGVSIQKDGILVDVFSDPYNDTRYYGDIKFPFQKGSVPPVDAFLKTVDEVMTVQPADDKDKGAQNNQAAAPAAAAPAAPAAPLAVIAPPPPPADAPPPTIAIGQTKDQVTTGFGQPVRTAKLAGTKEIYFYKDMKVTFTNGKVTNVE